MIIIRERRPSPSIIDALWEISRRLPEPSTEPAPAFSAVPPDYPPATDNYQEVSATNEINYGPLGPPPNDVIEEAV